MGFYESTFGQESKECIAAERAVVMVGLLNPLIRAERLKFYRSFHSREGGEE